MKSDMMDLRPYIPQLTIEERNRRWDATRECMAKEGIDCLIVRGTGSFHKKR